MISSWKQGLWVVSDLWAPSAERLWILTVFFFLNVSDSLNTYSSIKTQCCFRLNKLQSCAQKLLWLSHGILMIFLPIQLMKISTTLEDQEMKLWYRNGLIESQPGNVSVSFCFSIKKVHSFYSETYTIFPLTPSIDFHITTTFLQRKNKYLHGWYIMLLVLYFIKQMSWI